MLFRRAHWGREPCPALVFIHFFFFLLAFLGRYVESKAIDLQRCPDFSEPGKSRSSRVSGREGSKGVEEQGEPHRRRRRLAWLTYLPLFIFRFFFFTCFFVCVLRWD